MGVMPIIILASLFVAAGFAVAFVVAARSGQYDDVTTPAIRMLFEDEQGNVGYDNLGSQVDQSDSTFHHNLHGRV